MTASHPPLQRPEPCLAAPCARPSLCEGWGFCRQRIIAGAPSREEQAKLRELAAARRAKAGRAGG